MLFKIPKAELVRLDRHEGRGIGYDRQDAFPVRLVDGGETVQAVAYLATSPDSSLKPYDWYLSLVIAGAREHGLDADYLAALRAVAYGVDPEDGRETRAEAIKALSAAGISDYAVLQATE